MIPNLERDCTTYRLALNMDNLKRISRDMYLYLLSLQTTPAVWETAAHRFLGLLRSTMEKGYHKGRPGMMCQRSGKCCGRQTPRVSVFELAEVVRHVRFMPAEKQEAIKERCRATLTAEWKDPILGEGPACPMLGKDAEGKHICEVHNVRPGICFAQGIASPLSWDCPLWQVHKTKFPTLPKDQVRPFLELLSYCRNFYAEHILRVPNRAQMMLLGTGVLALMGERPPEGTNPVVAGALCHKELCSEDLWCAEIGPPPPQEVDPPAEPVG